MLPCWETLSVPSPLPACSRTQDRSSCPPWGTYTQHSDSCNRGSDAFVGCEPNWKLNILHQRRYFDIHSFNLHQRWSECIWNHSEGIEKSCIYDIYNVSPFAKKYFVQDIWSVRISNFYSSHLPFRQSAITLWSLMLMLYRRFRCSSSSGLPRKNLAEANGIQQLQIYLLFRRCSLTKRLYLPKQPRNHRRW